VYFLLEDYCGGQTLFHSRSPNLLGKQILGEDKEREREREREIERKREEEEDWLCLVRALLSLQ
jgi:hypothetical protein